MRRNSEINPPPPQRKQQHRCFITSQQFKVEYYRWTLGVWAAEASVLLGRFYLSAPTHPSSLSQYALSLDRPRCSDVSLVSVFRAQQS